MATTVLEAYSKAYPSITNRLKAYVTKQSAPLAIIASIIDTTPGHPQRTWAFPGLPRDNYRFRLDEIDAGGLAVQNLADFDVVPGKIDGYLSRADEQIQVGVTTGLVAGASTFVFDGTGGKPDYVGWDITVAELYARGIMQKGTADYSWDKDTGTFTLLTVGDIFATGQWYNIHFNPINNTAGGSYPTLRDFGVNLITADTIINDTYFGKKLIVEPSGTTLNITLPSIATIVEGRPLMIETSESASVYCVRVVTVDGIIKWLRGDIRMLPGERVSLYVYIRAGVPEWRVCDVDGNFRNLGMIVSEDNVPADVFNKQLLDGSIVDKDQFGRIYNEHVLNLPLTQVCDFDSWSTGNNKYLYSFANSVNPSFANKFHFPDRRDLYERANNTGKAGDYQADTVGPLTSITFEIRNGAQGSGTGSMLNTGFAGQDIPAEWLPNGAPGSEKYIKANITSGAETRPKSVLQNKYVLI